MEQELSGKVALVTGSSRRIGAAIVRKLHGAGARVVIHHNQSAAASHALAAELNGIREQSATSLGGDILDIKVLESLVAGTLARFGRLDILVNNASTFYPTPVGTITEQHWTDLMGTNLKAPIFLSQAAAPELRKNSGLILNIVDIHGQRPLRFHTVYSPAKAGLIMLTQSLARELAPDVRVNGIAPGPIEFPEGLPEEMRQAIIEKTLLGRQGCPDDIARAALFFAASAPYVTGQILAVDGGRSARS